MTYPLIGDAELASMQTEGLRSMTSVATVLHKVSVEDTQGGFTETYPTAGAAQYPCSYARYQARSYEREDQPRVQLVADWTFRFPLEADIRPTDRLLADGRTFEVVDPGIGTYAIVRQVLCLEIT